MSEDFSDTGKFAYQTAMSMADFSFNLFLTGGMGGAGAKGGLVAADKAAKTSEKLTLGIMGTRSAAETVIDAKERGLDDNQAFALGTIAGLAEVATEKLSIDAFFKNVPKGGFMSKADAVKTLTKSIGKNAFTEGTEEVASDIVNLMADLVISKDKSEWQETVNSYKEQGYTEGEAFAKALADQAKNTGLSFLGGFISGGVFSGGAYAGDIATRVKDSASDYLERSKESTVNYDTSFAQGRTGTEEDIANVELAKQMNDAIESAEVEDAWQEKTSELNITETENNEPDTIELEKTETEPTVESLAEDNALKSELESPQKMLQRAAETKEAEARQSLERKLQEFNDSVDAADSTMGKQGKDVLKRAYKQISDMAYNNNLSLEQETSIHERATNAMNLAYEAGITTDPALYERALADTSFSPFAEAAYRAGVADRMAALSKEEVDVKAKQKNGRVVYSWAEAGFKNSIATQAMREARQDGVEVMSDEDFGTINSVLKALGARGNFAREIAGGKSAKYDPATGEITIALNANPEMVLKEYVKHESVHRIKDLSSDAYYAMEEAVLKQLNNEGIYEETFREYKDVLDDSYTEEGIHEEIVADYIAQMEESDKVVNDFLRDLLGTKQGRTVIQTLRDFFRELATKFKGTATGHRYSEMGQTFADALETASQKVADIRQTGENVSVSNTNNEHVKTSPLDAENSTSMNDDGFNRVYVKRFDSKRSSMIEAKLNELRKQGKVTTISAKEVNSIKIPKEAQDGENRKYLKSILTKAFGEGNVSFSINGNQITAYLTREGKEHFNKFNDLSKENVAIAQHMRGIIINAEYLFSNEHEDHNTKVKRVDQWDKFISLVDIGDGEYSVILSLRKMQSDIRHQLYAISAKKEGTGQTADRGSNNQGIASNMTSSSSFEENITQSSEEGKKFAMQ